MLKHHDKQLIKKNEKAKILFIGKMVLYTILIHAKQIIIDFSCSLEIIMKLRKIYFISVLSYDETKHFSPTRFFFTFELTRYKNLKYAVATHYKFFILGLAINAGPSFVAIRKIIAMRHRSHFVHQTAKSFETFESFKTF